MPFKNRYYEVVGHDIQEENNSVCFDIHLLPDFAVYRGHFPGNPVSPGVCNIETIRELAMMATGEHLIIKSIQQCRFLSVITPQITPQLTIHLHILSSTEGYTINANITDKKKIYMTFRGSMTHQAHT